MAGRGRIIDGRRAEPVVPNLQRTPAGAVPAFIGIQQKPPVRDAFAPPPPPVDPAAEAERARLAEAALVEREKRTTLAERDKLTGLQAKYADRLAELTMATV